MATGSRTCWYLPPGAVGCGREAAEPPLPDDSQQRRDFIFVADCEGQRQHRGARAGEVKTAHNQLGTMGRSRRSTRAECLDSNGQRIASRRLRYAVEQLQGPRIAPDEEISVAALPPQSAPPSDSRAAVARNLEAFLNRRAEAAARPRKRRSMWRLTKPSASPGAGVHEDSARYEHPRSSNFQSQGTSEGTSSLIVNSPEHVLLLSPFILKELERVFEYGRVRRATGLTDGEVAEYLSYIGAKAVCEIVFPARPAHRSIGRGRRPDSSYSRGPLRRYPLHAEQRPF